MEWTTEQIKTLRKNLLTWYAREFRDLPWRKTKNPYKIWVSEIMLQQTQVKKVIPYYLEFVRTFPTIADLAKADLSRVLKKWEGLGYYARARNLKKAAQKIMEEMNGQFPHTLYGMLSLPGIGPYTVSAIASIAFGSVEPVVDGNVNRVLCRVLKIEHNPKSSKGREIVYQHAIQFISPNCPGDYNQAIMELGALICKPKQPTCRACPIAELCDAYEEDLQQLYPRISAKRDRPHHIIAAGLVWRDGELLIDRRREDAMLGGLWEFPGGKVKPDEIPSEAVVREVEEEVDVKVATDHLFMIVNHQYSHFTITLHVFHCHYLSGNPRALGCSEWRWVRKEELKDFAFPRANVKVIEKLLNE